MKLVVAWAFACPLLVVCSLPARDKGAPLAQEELVGDWVNVEKGAVLRHLSISAKGENWSVEAWCASDDRDKPGKKVGLALFGAERGAKSRPYGFATLEFDLATDHLTLRIEKGELVVETFTIYKLQPDQNYRAVARFKKNK